MIRKFYETTYARIEVRATVSMDTTLTNLRSLSTDSRSDHEVIVPFKHNHCQAFYSRTKCDLLKSENIVEFGVLRLFFSGNFVTIIVV